VIAYFNKRKPKEIVLHVISYILRSRVVKNVISLRRNSVNTWTPWTRWTEGPVNKKCPLLLHEVTFKIVGKVLKQINLISL